MIYTTYLMMMMMSLCLEAAKKKVQWFPLFNSEHAKKKLVIEQKQKSKVKCHVSAIQEMSSAQILGFFFYPPSLSIFFWQW